MAVLTLNEEMLLLAIWRLGSNAYGVTIMDQVREISGKKIVYGTLYNSLDNLVKKSYVATEEGEPTPERGGRRKVFYSLTKKGAEALRETRKLHLSMWEGISDIALGSDEGKTK
jgi:DNA-binding PadR family transcriptional regulator